MTKTKPRIGIPYAQVLVRYGLVWHECPECDQHIREFVDKTGELTSHNYAHHYEKEHDGN